MYDLKLYLFLFLRLIDFGVVGCVKNELNKEICMFFCL